MAQEHLKYRKNFGLLIAFAALVTALFVVAMGLARTMMLNFVETAFNNRKVEVFDRSAEPFNRFFEEKIPEISYYQGFLDSAKAASYLREAIRKTPFVERVLFYDVIVTNRDSIDPGLGIRYNRLLIQAQGIISFSPQAGNKLLVRRINAAESWEYEDDFTEMALDFVGLLEGMTESTVLSHSAIYKVFYTLSEGKIAYLNIPRMADLHAYKRMMTSAEAPVATYDQDMFVFLLDPAKIAVQNVAPKLYERIEIQPIVYGNISDRAHDWETEFVLPGALSGYKLVYSSSEDFINREVNRRFLPVSAGISAIYLILIGLAYLIYRNLAINGRLFRLQYDFINNLTHEFKTPVSVIKIAGNNIGSAESLSAAEQRMYANILDQEADKLSALMNKLLSFAQIENKAIKPKLERLDVEEFCEPIFAATALKYPDMAFGHTIRVENDMLVDGTLLASVFQNLIDNAYKYSPPDRKSLYIDIGQNKKNFIVKFADKGIGIDKKEFNRIFKKFYRVKNRFNQQGSIGLGLAFCKEIVDFMGGEIRVDSVPDRGTTFAIHLPLGPKKT